VSLFPRLRENADPALASAFDALDALERDHDAADADHAAVDVLVRRWLTDGCLPNAETGELRDRLARLQALYRRHIAIEDHEIFPAAARALGREQIRQIGSEMAGRRHVRPINLDEL
jgi:hemerythrin-like domain-containing protein